MLIIAIGEQSSALWQISDTAKFEVNAVKNFRIVQNLNIAARNW